MRAEIDKALAGLAPIPGDCGDEYRRAPFLTASGDLSDHLESVPPAFTARERPRVAVGGDGGTSSSSSSSSSAPPPAPSPRGGAVKHTICPTTRLLVSSDTTWENAAGFSRAVRVGDTASVSGTTATDRLGRVVGGCDAAAQASRALVVRRRLVSRRAAVRTHSSARPPCVKKRTP